VFIIDWCQLFLRFYQITDRGVDLLVLSRRRVCHTSILLLRRNELIVCGDGAVGKPDPLVFHIPQTFFDCLQQRMSFGVGGRKKRLPNTSMSFVRRDAVPLGSFVKYTWRLTNVLHIKQIFDTPQVTARDSLKKLRNHKCCLTSTDLIKLNVLWLVTTTANLVVHCGCNQSECSASCSPHKSRQWIHFHTCDMAKTGRRLVSLFWLVAECAATANLSHFAAIQSRWTEVSWDEVSFMIWTEH